MTTATSTASNLIVQAQHVYAVHPVASYTLIYIGTIFFGNVVVLGALWLAWIEKLGVVGIAFTCAVVLVAHFSGDMLWYWLGRVFSDTGFGHFLRKRMPKSDQLEVFLDRHRVMLVASGKLLMAPVIPLLFFAGWYKWEFKRYLRLSVISMLIWFPIIAVIAYGVLSGAIALAEGSILITLSILVIFIAASFFVVHYAVMPRVKKYWEA